MSFKKEDFLKTFDKDCDRCKEPIALGKHHEHGWIPLTRDYKERHVCRGTVQKDNGFPDGPPETFPEEEREETHEQQMKRVYAEDGEGPVEMELKEKTPSRKVYCPMKQSIPGYCNENCAWYINGSCAVWLLAISLPGAGRGY